MKEKNIGYLIKSISDKLRMRADADMVEHNLTLSQCRVHAYLNHHDGEATQKEIETFMEVSHPTVVGIISRMERAGHVVTRTDETDKRNKIVRLTDESRAMGWEIEQTTLAREKAMLAPLTEKEVSELRRMLEIIYQNIDRMN
ncbi:MAG: MarR family transcriptional regulator [Lachnospiraceae bacterium]|nr:MarR family transcriptional regulator [Lachnospiraceae bacterium]MBR0107415.1 MarR family transcriptional regulator [Lachnospiraceae bacterium]